MKFHKYYYVSDFLNFINQKDFCKNEFAKFKRLFYLNLDFYVVGISELSELGISSNIISFLESEFGEEIILRRDILNDS